jgi:hypothetical protein
MSGFGVGVQTKRPPGLPPAASVLLLLFKDSKLTLVNIHRFEEFYLVWFVRVAGFLEVGGA